MANEDWAKDTNTRPEVLAMLSTSPSEAVRLLVAQNPMAPETALLHLARDESDAVRRAIAHRSQVSSEVLRVATLSREALAELDAAALTPAEPIAIAPAAAAVQEAAVQKTVSQPAPQPPAPARRPSLLAWFWRLLGR